MVEAEGEEDWINALEILEMLAKREDEVARDIKEGKFITLGELQNKLGKQMYELVTPRSVEKDIGRLPCQLQKIR